MRISDWSSVVCSADLGHRVGVRIGKALDVGRLAIEQIVDAQLEARLLIHFESELDIVVEDGRRTIADVFGRGVEVGRLADPLGRPGRADAILFSGDHAIAAPLRITAIAATDMAVELDRRTALERIDGVVVEPRSEEHTSELQSLMRISYAV